MSSGRKVVDKLPVIDPWQTELQRAHADITAKLEAARGSARQPLFGVDAAELLERRFDAPRWLVTGLITRGGLAMIGAEPKAAKTWLATEIAVAIATGTRVCGEFTAEHGRVAYFYAEDLDVQIRNRVRALLAGTVTRHLVPGRLHLEPRGTFLDVTKTDDLALLIASCRRLGSPDLLILDPFRDIHTGDEIASDVMHDVLRRVRVASDLIPTTTLIPHHTPKLSKDNAKRRAGQNLRGSSAIHGAVDSGLYVQDSDGDGTNSFVNAVTSQVKGARSAGRFELRLDVTDDELGEAISAKWTHRRFAAGPITKPPSKADANAEMKRKAEQADDAKVVTFIRDLAAKAEEHSRTALRNHDARPIPDRRVRDALDRLIEAGQLVVRDGKVFAPVGEGEKQPPQGSLSV